MRSRSAEGTARAQRLIVVSVIAIALGFLVVVQLRSQAAVARTLAAQDDTSVALLINDLNRANNELLQQGAALSQQEAQIRDALTFVFQAEDGIRDYKVTGVQTCALPI